MRAHHVRVTRTFSAPPERVFSYLSEHENLAELFGTRVTRLADGADGERNGVGSLRRLQLGPLPPFEETVTEYVVPERIVYRITKGSPLRGHVGVMQFSPHGEGTRLDYDIRLSSPVPFLTLLVQMQLTRSILAGLNTVEREA